MNNIWGTAEADAWSRDFGYSDYLRICKARECKPVSEKAYSHFRQAFHQAMEDDQAFQPVDARITTGGFIK